MLTFSTGLGADGITSREVAAQYRLGQWSQAMLERTQNGESIDEFCNRLGISRNKFFYWQRKLRDATCEQLVVKQVGGVQSFTEIKLAEDKTVASSSVEPGSLRIEVGGVKLTADSSYPTEKLAVLLRSIVEPC